MYKYTSDNVLYASAGVATFECITSFMNHESRNLDPQLGEILECGKYYGLISRVVAAWWWTQIWWSLRLQ